MASNAGPRAASPPLVMDIIKGRTTAAKLARLLDRTIAEVEQWMNDLIIQGTEVLRYLPRDAESKHRAKKRNSSPRSVNSPWNGREADMDRSGRDVPAGRHSRQKEFY